MSHIFWGHLYVARSSVIPFQLLEPVAGYPQPIRHRNLYAGQQTRAELDIHHPDILDLRDVPDVLRLA